MQNNKNFIVTLNDLTKIYITSDKFLINEGILTFYTNDDCVATFNKDIWKDCYLYSKLSPIYKIWDEKQLSQVDTLTVSKNYPKDISLPLDLSDDPIDEVQQNLTLNDNLIPSSESNVELVKLQEDNNLIENESQTEKTKNEPLLEKIEDDNSSNIEDEDTQNPPVISDIPEFSELDLDSYLTDTPTNPPNENDSNDSSAADVANPIEEDAIKKKSILDNDEENDFKNELLALMNSNISNKEPNNQSSPISKTIDEEDTNNLDTTEENTLLDKELEDNDNSPDKDINPSLDTDTSFDDLFFKSPETSDENKEVALVLDEDNNHNIDEPTDVVEDNSNNSSELENTNEEPPKQEDKEEQVIEEDPFAALEEMSGISLTSNPIIEDKNKSSKEFSVESISEIDESVKNESTQAINDMDSIEALLSQLPDTSHTAKTSNKGNSSIQQDLDVLNNLVEEKEKKAKTVPITAPKEIPSKKEEEPLNSETMRDSNGKLLTARERKIKKEKTIEATVIQYCEKFPNFNAHHLFVILSKNVKARQYNITEDDIIWTVSKMIKEAKIENKFFHNELEQKKLQHFLPPIIDTHWDGTISNLFSAIKTIEQLKNTSLIDLTIWLSEKSYI